MLGAVALTGVAAVLCGNDVAMVATAPLAVVRHVPLPSRGAAVFAAPDGSVLVPIVSDDATAVIDAGGTVRVWQGRIFPLFFDEPDRMLVVVPGALMMLSYPERLPLARVPLEGVDGAWRAACSTDGRLAAIVPVATERKRVVLTGTRGGGPTYASGLAAPAEAVVVAPDAAWAAVGHADGSLELIIPGGGGWRGGTGVPGRVTALAVSGTGKYLIAAVESEGGGAIVNVRVAPEKREPLHPRFVTHLPAPPAALACAGDDVLVVAGDAVLLLTKRGRRIDGSVAVPGASDVVMLAEHPVSLIPPWSD
jgi:hypothetical protein